MNVIIVHHVKLLKNKNTMLGKKRKYNFILKNCYVRDCICKEFAFMINNQELEIKTYHPIDTTSQEHSVLFRFKHNIYESMSLFFSFAPFSSF